MEELKLVFIDDEKSAEKCKLLAANHTDAVHLEGFSVSEHSPSIVANDETVARQIFSPLHYDDSLDEIKASAFTDVNNKGLSVNRLRLVEERAIHEQGQSKELADNTRLELLDVDNINRRKYLGFTKANVQDIRADLENEKRVFAIYDSALLTTPSHADICLIKQDVVDGLSKKSANMFRRKRLQEMFGKLQVGIN
jgi:hypothetical protein